MQVTEEYIRSIELNPLGIRDEDLPDGWRVATHEDFLPVHPLSRSYSIALTSVRGVTCLGRDFAGRRISAKELEEMCRDRNDDSPPTWAVPDPKNTPVIKAPRRQPPRPPTKTRWPHWDSACKS